MRFTNRWEQTEDDLWETKDNAKYKNGAVIFKLDDNAFFTYVWMLAGDDAVSLQTARRFPKSLDDAKGLAEEFIERLEKKFNG